MEEKTAKGILELEETLKDAHSVDQEFYEQLLSDYAIQVYSLKLTDNIWFWEHAIEIQERQDQIKITICTDEEFEEYILLGDLLVVLFLETKVFEGDV